MSAALAQYLDGLEPAAHRRSDRSVAGESNEGFLAELRAVGVLGREERRRMLSSLRAHFSSATLLCVTHDVCDTLDFDRVLVIERGRILEQGAPRTLQAQPGSRYRALLEEEGAVRGDLWANAPWRRLRLRAGRIMDGGAVARAEEATPP